MSAFVWYSSTMTSLSPSVSSFPLNLVLCLCFFFLIFRHILILIPTMVIILRVLDFLLGIFMMGSD